MRIEIPLVVLTAAVISNIYTEGYVYRKLLSYKKYYQMFGVFCLSLFFYYVFKKNPQNSHKVLLSTNEYLKYLPIDKNASDILTPILNFTSSSSSSAPAFAPSYLGGGGGRDDDNDYEFPQAAVSHASNSISSSTTKIKRVVSETKKKFVAARQNWRCNLCQRQLNAWFEIDHINRLEYGGTNHVDNLSALCRECHGQKTTIENL